MPSSSHFLSLSNFPDGQVALILLQKYFARSSSMGTLTGSRTRTITGHISNLLDYPKWLIERDVDFTHCDFDGHYDDTNVQCRECRFSAGCRWLVRIREIDPCQADLDALTAALRGAVRYVAARNADPHNQTHNQPHNGPCNCEQCTWLTSARRLLRSMSR